MRQMKKVFPRYIARSFWGPFFFGLGVFVALMLFGSMFDKLGTFAKTQGGGGLLAKYLFYQLPYYAVKMTPIATLLAVLFALGGMLAGGEWKAGLAGGWRPWDMVRPLVFCAAGAALLQFAVQELAAPGAYMKSEQIVEAQVRGREDWRRQVQRDVSFYAGGESFVSARVFDGRKGEMQGLIIDSYREGRQHLQVNAASAHWDASAGRWTARGASVAVYGSGKLPSLKRYETFGTSVAIPPGDLVIEKLVPDGISALGAARRARRLRSIGAPSTGEMIAFYSKLAAPLVNIAMALMGAAVLFLLKLTNRVFNFGLAMAVGFFFWGLMIFGQSAGMAELVSPAAAGLGPLAVFLGLSWFAARRAGVA